MWGEILLFIRNLTVCIILQYHSTSSIRLLRTLVNNSISGRIKGAISVFCYFFCLILFLILFFNLPQLYLDCSQFLLYNRRIFCVSVGNVSGKDVKNHTLTLPLLPVLKVKLSLSGFQGILSLLIIFYCLVNLYSICPNISLS